MVVAELPSVVSAASVTAIVVLRISGVGVEALSLKEVVVVDSSGFSIATRSVVAEGASVMGCATNEGVDDLLLEAVADVVNNFGLVVTEDLASPVDCIAGLFTISILFW